MLDQKSRNEILQIFQTSIHNEDLLVRLKLYFLSTACHGDSELLAWQVYTKLIKDGCL